LLDNVERVRRRVVIAVVFAILEAFYAEIVFIAGAVGASNSDL
jgi:hypothetical protein